MKKIQIPLLGLIIVFAMVSCDKLERPPLPSDYPTDNPVTPSTPLRFFLSFDSTTADDQQINIRFKDSISSYPSFFPDPSVSYSSGVTGTAYQGSSSAFIHYVNANDFGASQSFTMSFWINIPLSQKDNDHAVGLLALMSTLNFWGEATWYIDNTTKGNSDSMDLKVHFANGTGDNWDFAGYTGSNRWPHMYDGNWHMITFTYDFASKTGTMYRDGVQFDQKTNETIAFDGKAANVIVGAFEQGVGFLDNTGTLQTYANNTWMGYYSGAVDQVRFYNTALSASDVSSLYNNKQ